MKVKPRIYLSQCLIALLVLLMAGVAYVSIRTMRYYVQRVQWAEHQLEAITAVAMHANRHSEQIAELLLVGESERADYRSASAQLQAGLDRLERVTRDESAFLVKHGRHDDSRDELYRIARMRQLQREIDRSVAQLVRLRQQDRIADSVDAFRRRIENRLDAEFEHLLTAAMLDEQEEVDAADRQVETLWRRLQWIIALVTLAVLVMCALIARQLSRALVRPVAELTAGAEAIGEDDLTHRIRYEGDDELGLLARRFNQMAIQLERQRAQLLAAQSQLERQVAERTRELALANERLTELDRIRVQFLADISHELRTPLTALRGEAEVALRQPPQAEAAYREALERIVELSRDMGRLVEDLLFLARTETDTLRFVMLRLSLQELVGQFVREGSALGHAKSIEVRFVADGAPSDGPLWVMADAQRLRQAFMILIDNAVKYSAPGETVELRLERLGSQAQVSVCDHGRGIRAEELPRVFDRYYRGLAPGSPGAGLGLAIARWLVEKHGGDIALTSEVGRYTQVRIRLPLVEAEP